MVGDSLEDIETANAAGTASCLIAGGGNETSSGPAPPPPLGAVPTFSVDSLAHLQQRLAQCNTALGWGAYGEQRTMSLSSGTWDEEDEEEGSLSALLLGVPQLSTAGAPPAGLDFLAALFDSGAVQAASCSFPRIDGARFGVPPDAHPGDRVLHLGCGDGALTKLLFARGVQVGGPRCPRGWALQGSCAGLRCKAGCPGNHLLPSRTPQTGHRRGRRCGGGPAARPARSAAGAAGAA